jgi:hypothetical protein
MATLAVLTTASLAHADVDEFDTSATAKKEGETAAAKKKVPWRNSTVTYENIFSAYTLSEGAEQTYNPYYAMSFDFRPRFYLRDDLSLRARLVMDVELTTPDSDFRRFLLSDTSFDAVYAPSFLKIPYADISVIPSVRFKFPTSIVSQGRSMISTIGPALMLLRELPLLKGPFLKSIGLLYAFRGTKEFYRYAVAQIGEREGCYNSTRPECQHSGNRNRSWRLTNTFEVKLQLMEKLSLTIDYLLINDLLHKLDAEEVAIEGGTVSIEESRINHRVAHWAIFDISYDLLDWLWLSAGTSTYYAVLAPDSTFRTPFFNRATNVYFDVTIPIDPMVRQVQSWVN